LERIHKHIHPELPRLSCGRLCVCARARAPTRVCVSVFYMRLHACKREALSPVCPRYGAEACGSMDAAPDSIALPA
jgi:hypothetical protein